MIKEIRIEHAREISAMQSRSIQIERNQAQNIKRRNNNNNIYVTIIHDQEGILPMIKGLVLYLNSPMSSINLFHFADLVKVFMRKVNVLLLENFLRKE